MIDFVFSVPFLAAVGVATIAVIAVIILRVTVKYTAFILIVICAVIFGLVKWGIIEADMVDDFREKLHLDVKKRVGRKIHER